MEKHRSFRANDGAQLHTLEGFTGAFLLVSAVVFVIDATSITPLTSSTANEHVEAELQMLGEDVLTWADYSVSPETTPSNLKTAILRWSGKEFVWDGVRYTDAVNASDQLDNSLTRSLTLSFVSWGIAHNVELIFTDNASGNLDGKRMVYNGKPSRNAVTVSRSIVLYDTDVTSAFYNATRIGDAGPSTGLYNMVDVRLTLWRM